jgi:hypothetical protein
MESAGAHCKPRSGTHSELGSIKYRNTGNNNALLTKHDIDCYLCPNIHILLLCLDNAIIDMVVPTMYCFLYDIDDAIFQGVVASFLLVHG